MAHRIDNKSRKVGSYCSLEDKTLFITGASRGIGKAIGIKAAKQGANIVIAAKTTTPHPRLPGTIYDAAEEIEASGGRALALPVDIRYENQIVDAVAKAADMFGGIDILVNNASAISLTSTLDTPLKKFDLMHQVNIRGTFLCTQHVLPYLRRAENPHVLMISPPPNLHPKWFSPHVAYTTSKYGMSFCVLGMADEFKAEGIAFNALWPRTAIDTSAVRNLMGGEQAAQNARTVQIVADAAEVILTRDSRSCTGNFFIDEEVLRMEGIENFDQYAVAKGAQLAPDFFI